MTMPRLNRITNTEPGVLRRLRFVTVCLVKHWRASKTPLAARIAYTSRHVKVDMAACARRGTV
jgi:hypothetical protein